MTALKTQVSKGNGHYGQLQELEEEFSLKTFTTVVISLHF